MVCGTDFFYPRMTRFIYGTDKPYITQDEHKINEHGLSILTEILQSDSLRQNYFLLIAGRIFPARRRVEKIDRVFLSMIGSAGRVFARRVGLGGTNAK